MIKMLARLYLPKAAVLSAFGPLSQSYLESRTDFGWVALPKYTRHFQFSETKDKETFDSDKYQGNLLVTCFENWQQFDYKWYPANTCVSLQ